MTQGRINPKLADAIMAQAEQEQQDEQQLWPDQSEYTPPWLELDRIKAEFATDAEEISFQIFRQGAGGIKDLAFVKSVAQDVFGYELLQSPPFNGGRFRVYIRKEGGGIRRNFLIDVEPGPDAVKPGVTANAPDQGIAAMIAAMSAGFTTLSQQIARNQAQAPAGMGIKETIELLAAMRPLMSAPAQAPAAPIDPLEMIGKIVRLQRDLAPIPTDSDGGISGTAILMKAMDTFGPVLSKSLATPQSAPASDLGDTLANPVQSLPASAPDAADPNSPAPEGNTAMKVAIIAPMILLAANNQADPYPYACNCLDLFDDEQLQKYIQSNDWWTNLIAILPEAEKHPAWFNKLREEVLTILQESVEPDRVVGEVLTN